MAMGGLNCISIWFSPLLFSSWTNRLITSRDRGSVQINIGSVDPKTGLYTGKFTPVALSGYIRSKGEGDLALTELATRLDAASA